MRFTLSAITILISTVLCAQAPALIPYQAIARNAAGESLANTTLNARFTIHNVSATGENLWQEIQTVTTTELGLFTVQLGSNVALTSLNWSNGAKFMQVEIDLGNGFIDIGTQQLLSVPFALYSGEAQTSGNGISRISFDGDTLYLANGSFLIVPGISGANYPVPIEVYGCIDSSACNYNINATADDGTCSYPGSPCSDGNIYSFGDSLNLDCICRGVIDTMAMAHSCGTYYVHNPELTYGTMTDQQGNSYKTTVIGTQEWMAENLSTSIYRNGDEIPTGLSNSEWQNTSITQLGAWAFYNNDASNNCPYGKLYNWYACVDSRGLCPVGWHVPTDGEWTLLYNYLGGASIAGGKMKSAGRIQSGNGNWNSPNTGASNSSGFSGIPHGYRNDEGGYGLIGDYGSYWSSTQYVFGSAWYPFLYYTYAEITRVSSTMRNGLGVRCLRD